jgi:hypothetical protein
LWEILSSRWGGLARRSRGSFLRMKILGIKFDRIS